MFRHVLRTAAVGAAALAAPLAISAGVRADGSAEPVHKGFQYAPPPALDPSAFKAFKVSKVEPLTKDTAKYTFDIGANQEAGMPVSSFLLVKANIDGKDVIRPYTPTSPRGQRGSFELVVKAYPTGNVSKMFGALKEGDSVDIKGPLVKFHYKPNEFRALGMIAGGSGITPMLQVIQEILSNPRDATEVRLIYASRSPGDIILKEELDALEAVHPQFKVLYVVDEAAAAPGWKGAVGHIDEAMITGFLPPPRAPREDGSADVKVLVCGPPGMMKHVSGEKKAPTDQGELAGLLAKLRYPKEQVFKY